MTLPYCLSVSPLQLHILDQHCTIPLMIQEIGLVGCKGLKTRSSVSVFVYSHNLQNGALEVQKANLRFQRLIVVTLTITDLLE